MAGRWLETIIFVSSAGSLALAVVALTVLTLADARFLANKVLFAALMEVAIPWGAYLLWVQVRWLCLGGEQPGRAKLWVLVASEWLAACVTIATACASLAGDLFALQHDCCTSTAACLICLVGAAMACAAGALAAVSALGMLWIVGSQFRPV
uniref:Uncharacterized protein n=2 Tax=Avena sativa TaxID=4498 RepID=A0ACD5YSZ4_AVESA